MDFWNWLQQVFSNKARGSLSDNISSVLSRDAEGATSGYSWPTSSPGGTKENPITLPTVTAEGAREFSLPPEVRDLLLSRFVQDTLFPLVGGAPSSYGYQEKPSWPFASNTMGAVQNTPEDPHLVLFGPLFNSDRTDNHRRNLISHEGGHMFSMRDIDPEIIKAVKAQWTPELQSVWGQRAKNSEELFAEAFARALEFVQESDNRLRQSPNPGIAYKEMQDTRFLPPGADLLIQYLIAQPQFAGHPLNQLKTQ